MKNIFKEDQTILLSSFLVVASPSQLDYIYVCSLPIGRTHGEKKTQSGKDGGSQAVRAEGREG
jgi:hypothetical protein